MLFEWRNSLRWLRDDDIHLVFSCILHIYIIYYSRDMRKPNFCLVSVFKNWTEAKRSNPKFWFPWLFLKPNLSHTNSQYLSHSHKVLTAATLENNSNITRVRSKHAKFYNWQIWPIILLVQFNHECIKVTLFLNIIVVVAKLGKPRLSKIWLTLSHCLSATSSMSSYTYINKKQGSLFWDLVLYLHNSRQWHDWHHIDKYNMI